MNKEEAHYADTISNSNGDILKVDRIGDNGEIFYLLYMSPSGSVTKPKSPESPHFGYIWDFHPATPEQKRMLERWIIDNSPKQ